MKYLKTQEVLDADSADDAKKPTQLLEQRLSALNDALNAADDPEGEVALKAMIESGYVYLDLTDETKAWEIARKVFDIATRKNLWIFAVEACDIMSQTDHIDSTIAIAHGIWLSVTFPVDPELTVAMLQHLIDNTPDNSDGAALAAAMAKYVVDLRSEGQARENLQFFTGQMLGQVARRHSNVEEQDIFDFWIETNQLDDPARIVERLAKVVDVLVGESWWIDRDALRATLPH